MKKFNILIVAIIPLLIILLGFRLLVFDYNFYDKEFKKNNIYDNFSENLVRAEVNNLFNYFTNDQELETDFFNEIEKIHLSDVKNLINSVINLLMLLVIIVIGFFIYYFKAKKLKIFLNSIFLGSLLNLFFIIISLILVLLNFDFIFLSFHLNLFNNDYWLLSSNDNLINLFPQQFFYDAAIRIILYTLIISSILLFIAFIFKNRLTK